jgi:hypothetical protein
LAVGFFHVAGEGIRTTPFERKMQGRYIAVGIVPVFGIDVIRGLESVFGGFSSSPGETLTRCLDGANIDDRNIVDT